MKRENSEYIKPFLIVLAFLAVLVYIIFSGNFTNSTAIINMDKKIESKVFDKNKKLFLVFFGYVGCDDICTPRLKEIVPIYEELKDKKDIEVYFINLIYLKNTDLPDMFAKVFHKEFKGVYLERDELYDIIGEFGVYSSPSISSKGDYDHTSFLFLVENKNNEMRLKRIYTNTPFDKKGIVEDINRNFN